MKTRSKTMTVVALSLLVFPGSGHFVLGRAGRGLIWIAVFLLVLIALLVLFALNLGKITSSMMSPTGDVPLDVQQITIMACLGLSSFLVWGLAGLDAYWLARSLPPEAQDVGESQAPKQGPPVPAPPPDFNRA
jgi:hypothetical protein